MVHNLISGNYRVTLSGCFLLYSFPPASLCASIKSQPENNMGGMPVDSGAGGVKAPDGGWGWAVLAGCFVITGFSYAFPKAVSVFFKELIREFGVGYSDTAWVSSILLAMLYGTGMWALVQNIHTAGLHTRNAVRSIHYLYQATS